MKRTLLLVMSICLFTGGISFAQKRNVKDAKSAMDKNQKEARELIAPALKHEETKNDPETWKVAGDIELKAYDVEYDKEALKAFNKTGGNEKLMFEGLYNLYLPYLKADELGELPDEKDKIKNKVRKSIARDLKRVYPQFINTAYYFNQQKDPAKALEVFERYWDMPNLPMFADDKASFNRADTTYNVAKYYAVLMAREAKQNKKAIDLLNRILKEGYVTNTTYNESAIYELLASESLVVGDSATFVQKLEEGAKLFPKNTYFISNLINVYIKQGKSEEAIAYLDQAILNDPSNTCELHSVKASLFHEIGQIDKAEEVFKDAIAKDKTCLRSLEGLSILYLSRGRDLREEASQIRNNRHKQVEIDNVAVEYFKKAIPLLVDMRTQLEASTDVSKIDLRPTLGHLQNIYYILGMETELQEIEQALLREIEKHKNI